MHLLLYITSDTKEDVFLIKLMSKRKIIINYVKKNKPKVETLNIQ